MNIIFATDGSAESEMAAKRLCSLGIPHYARIVILHVIEPADYWVTPAVPPSYVSELYRVQYELEEEAKVAAERAIQHAIAILSKIGVELETVTAEGHAAEEIVKTAQETSADLVVVGSRGLSGSRVFLLGSVSNKVIKYAPCSVLVSKGTTDQREPGQVRLVLATDGSAHAISAAELVSWLDLKEHAEIQVLHVLKPEPHHLLHSKASQTALGQLHKARLEEAERIVQQTRDNITTSAAITTIVREGDPTEEILKACTEMNADMIVIGSKGVSGIKGFLLGSVAQKVSRHSDETVILTRHKPTQPSGPEE